jgi:hypothetical protein
MMATGLEQAVATMMPQREKVVTAVMAASAARAALMVTAD